MYAQWKLDVQFDANGGIGEMETIQVQAHKKSGLPWCNFTRNGYEFAGWAQASGASKVEYVDKDTFEIGVPVKFYAVWKRRIIYISNDGDNDGDNKTSEQMVYGLIVSASTNLFVHTEDWVFKGWAMDKEGTGTVYTAGQELPTDLTTGQKLYAQWNLKIHFDGNGAQKGTMAPQEVKRNKGMALSPCTFKREGYVFMGWAESKDAKEADYGNGGKITITKPMTLYAVWRVQGGSNAFNIALGCDDAITFTTGTTGPEWEVCADGAQSGFKFDKEGYSESELVATLPYGGTVTFECEWKPSGGDDVWEFRVNGEKKTLSPSNNKYTYTCSEGGTVSWCAKVKLSSGKLLLKSVSWEAKSDSAGNEGGVSGGTLGN